MKDMTDQINRNFCIGWEVDSFTERKYGIGFRVFPFRDFGLWGAVQFSPRDWKIGFNVQITPHWGYGGGLYANFHLLPVWVSVRLGID